MHLQSKNEMVCHMQMLIKNKIKNLIAVLSFHLFFYFLPVKQ